MIIFRIILPTNTPTTKRNTTQSRNEYEFINIFVFKTTLQFDSCLLNIIKIHIIKVVYGTVYYSSTIHLNNFDYKCQHFVVCKFYG